MSNSKHQPLYAIIWNRAKGRKEKKEKENRMIRVVEKYRLSSFLDETRKRERKREKKIARSQSGRDRAKRVTKCTYCKNFHGLVYSLNSLFYV